MFHSSSLNSKTNRLRERCLRIFIMINRQTLKNYWSEIILSLYIIEIFKVSQSKCLWLLLATRYMIQNFQLRESHYHYHYHISQFMAHLVHSVWSYLGPNISKLIALCILFLGSHSFWWKLLYDVRYSAHRNNITISLLIVHSWPPTQ